MIKTAWQPRVLPALACCGIALLVLGTFLPWLTSGRAERNSYAAGDALGTLLAVSGAARTALHLWPFVSLLGAVSVALLVLGRAYLGGALAGITALVAGVIAVAVLAHGGHGLVHPASQGPAITLVGAVTTVAAVAVFAFQRRTARTDQSRRTP